MRRWLRWLGVIVGVLLVGLGGLIAYVWFSSESMLAERFELAGRAVEVPTDAASLAEGKRLATARGCTECHGLDLGGGALDVGIARFWAPNLTSDPQGAASRFTSVEAWELAIRHGVGAGGRPLLMMPSDELVRLPDDELGKLIAYARSVPPVSRPARDHELTIIARALGVFGLFPLLPVTVTDHALAATPKPPRGPTVAYGEHLVRMACVGCHGEGLSGGRIPGTPDSIPEVANITPDPETGLGRWTEEQFKTALLTATRPDGTAIDPFMPAKSFAAMDDVELSAIWAYLQSVPARPKGGH
ncbi:MAG: c-type cytochrome [Deltaproteobacteria bacterium]|nr:c-type cytochrome [Deltaproteobacteria bacterium]MCB9786710.1 c-type cytochrome [Deltaproteobacteria bacterium]